MTFEELAIQFALALATRPHSDIYATNTNALKAARDLLQKLEEVKGQSDD